MLAAPPPRGLALPPRGNPGSATAIDMACEVLFLTFGVFCFKATCYFISLYHFKQYLQEFGLFHFSLKFRAIILAVADLHRNCR